MKFQKRHFQVLLFSALLFAGTTGTKLLAQTPNSLLWEPEFEVEFSTAERWSHSFGIANRSSVFTYVEGERVADAAQEHLELNHFTAYKTGSQSAVALGIRYRFREAFDESRHDELRFIEQFSYKHPETFLNWSHRFRFEQRLRELTIYRLRYQLGISRPLGEEFGLGLATEFLYSMVNGLSPEAEQRFTLKAENTSLQNIELSAGIEFRKESYLHSPENNFYLLTGVSLSL